MEAVSALVFHGLTDQIPRKVWIAFIVARYFGLRSYTAIYGMLYVSFALGAGMSPLIFGYNFDVYGNYHFMLTLSALVLIGGAAALLPLGRYRDFDATE